MDYIVLNVIIFDRSSNNVPVANFIPEHFIVAKPTALWYLSYSMFILFALKCLETI